MVTLLHKGSLMTYFKDGREICVGYLFDFQEHGIQDASLGRIDVTKEEMERHNILLSEGQIKGLEENCKVGMKGTFYVRRESREVVTFIGVKVADAEINGLGITFRRKGMVFRGRLSREDDCFNFRLVS